MITSHKVHVSKVNSLMVMGMFNVLGEGSFKNVKTHCVLRPSHNPLRCGYRRKCQEATGYKADVFENWRLTGLIFLLGKIQKGGGVSTRTKAFFGARYFIQPRGTFLKELKFLTPFKFLFILVFRFAWHLIRGLLIQLHATFLPNVPLPSWGGALRDETKTGGWETTYFPGL